MISDLKSRFKAKAEKLAKPLVPSFKAGKESVKVIRGGS